MKYATTLMLSGIMLFSLFSCGSDLSVDIPNIIEYIEVEVPNDEKGDVGGTIKVKEGVPNVIVQYVNQDYSEFVRPEDGRVKYIVYNEHKEPASYAVVTGLPGIVVPATGLPDLHNTYQADADGVFYVLPDELPENQPISVRTVPNGSTTGPKVEYTDSQGEHKIDIPAATTNIYVPNRMHIRINLNGKLPVLDGSSMIFPAIVVQRNDRDKNNENDWEQVPGYLGSWNKNITAFKLSNQNNPASYESGPPADRRQYNISPTSIDISSTTKDLKVTRLRKRTSYFRPNSSTPPIGVNEWDGADHYFTFVLDSFYGYKANLNAVIKMAPVQVMPMIKDGSVKAYSYNTIDKYFGRIEGEFDIKTAPTLDGIDYNHVYKTELKAGKTVGSPNYDYYYPEKEDEAVVKAATQFIVRFNVTAHNMNNLDNPASVTSPSFIIVAPFLDASVQLDCNKSYFYSLNTVGYLRWDADSSSWKIKRRTTFVDGNANAATGWGYFQPEITVIYL